MAKPRELATLPTATDCHAPWQWFVAGLPAFFAFPATLPAPPPRAAEVRENPRQQKRRRRSAKTRLGMRTSWPGNTASSGRKTPNMGIGFACSLANWTPRFPFHCPSCAPGRRALIHNLRLIGIMSEPEAAVRAWACCRSPSRPAGSPSRPRSWRRRRECTATATISRSARTAWTSSTPLVAPEDVEPAHPAADPQQQHQDPEQPDHPEAERVMARRARRLAGEEAQIGQRLRTEGRRLARPACERETAAQPAAPARPRRRRSPPGDGHSRRRRAPGRRRPAPPASSAAAAPPGPRPARARTSAVPAATSRFPPSPRRATWCRSRSRPSCRPCWCRRSRSNCRRS